MDLNQYKINKELLGIDIDENLNTPKISPEMEFSFNCNKYQYKQANNFNVNKQKTNKININILNNDKFCKKTKSRRSCNLF